MSVNEWELGKVRNHTKTSSGAQRVCVPAWRMLRRSIGSAARMESFGRRVSAYIQEYPATAKKSWINNPTNVMSKNRWSSCSSQFTSIRGRIDASIRHAEDKVSSATIWHQDNITIFESCYPDKNECHINQDMFQQAKERMSSRSKLASGSHRSVHTMTYLFSKVL